MNIRDVGTVWYLDLQRIRNTLDNFENFDDAHEMIAVAQELSADIETLENQIDLELELGMDEE